MPSFRGPQRFPQAPAGLTPFSQPLTRVNAVQFGATSGLDGLVATQAVDFNLHTICGWFRFRVTNVGSGRQMSGMSLEGVAPDTTGPYQLLCETTFNTDTIELHDQTNGGFLFTPTIGAPFEWVFICSTNDQRVGASTQTTFYYRREGDSTFVQSFTGNQHPFAVGAARFIIGTDDAGGQNEWWDGPITGVKVWNRVLSAAEVDAESRQLAPVSARGLFAYYPLQDLTFTDPINGRNLSPIVGGGSWSVVSGPAIPPGVLPAFDPVGILPPPQPALLPVPLARAQVAPQAVEPVLPIPNAGFDPSTGFPYPPTPLQTFAPGRAQPAGAAPFVPALSTYLDPSKGFPYPSFPDQVAPDRPRPLAAEGWFSFAQPAMAPPISAWGADSPSEEQVRTGPPWVPPAGFAAFVPLVGAAPFDPSTGFPWQQQPDQARAAPRPQPAGEAPFVPALATYFNPAGGFPYPTFPDQAAPERRPVPVSEGWFAFAEPAMAPALSWSPTYPAQIARQLPQQPTGDAPFVPALSTYLDPSQGFPYPSFPAQVPTLPRVTDKGGTSFTNTSTAPPAPLESWLPSYPDQVTPRQPRPLVAEGIAAFVEPVMAPALSWSPTYPAQAPGRRPVPEGWVAFVEPAMAPALSWAPRLHDLVRPASPAILGGEAAFVPLPAAPTVPALSWSPTYPAFAARAAPAQPAVASILPPLVVGGVTVKVFMVTGTATTSRSAVGVTNSGGMNLTGIAQTSFAESGPATTSLAVTGAAQ